MCLVDSSSTIDIESGDLNATEYSCNDCGNKFRALGSRIRCPSCMSKNVKKL